MPVPPMLTPSQLTFYRRVFLAAAAYNIIWGALVVLFPLAPFRWAGMPEPNYPELWQCIGMFVLVYAPGYAYLAADPVRYAPFALVGLLGKVCGPLGWLWAYHRGRLPAASGLTILLNDLIWWPLFIPFVWRTMVRREVVEARADQG